MPPKRTLGAGEHDSVLNSETRSEVVAKVEAVGDGDGGLSLDGLLGDFASEPQPESDATPAALGPYRCLRRTLVRDGHEAFSSVVGTLEAGEIVNIVEEQILENGASRLRLERAAAASGPVGWVSATGPTGQAFLVPGADEGEAGVSAPDSVTTPADPPASSIDNSEPVNSSAAQPQKSWLGWGSSTDTKQDTVANEVAADARPEGPLTPVERVRMISVVTRTDTKGKQYTAFGITVYPLPVAAGDGGDTFVTAEEWVVYRRFSEFVELRAQLVALDKTFEQLEFPSKRFNMFGGAAQVNTERRLTLERWLTAVLAQPISNKLVSKFVAPDLEPVTAGDASSAGGVESAAESAAESFVTPGPTLDSGPQDGETHRSWCVRKIKIAPGTAAGDGEQALGGGKEDTVYKMQIHPRGKGSEPWEVSRKYSEFCTLRAALRKSCGAVLRSNDRVFPVNRVWTRKQLDTKAAEDRLTALQTWIDNIVGLRPDEPALLDFVSPETVGDGENAATENLDADEVTGEGVAAWGVSLTSLISSPARAIMRGAGDDIGGAESEETAPEATPAGRELPMPLDAVWPDSEKFLTPTALHNSDASVQYPIPTQEPNEYTTENSGLLPHPSVELYRVTHDHRPGLGFKPLVVTRARITGISVKYSQGKEFTVYV